MKKMSVIFLDMAEQLFKNPTAIPSSEAAHAALLLAHAAWNRSIGENFPDAECMKMIRIFEQNNSSFWKEFKTANWKAMITDLIAYKKRRHSKDKRIVFVCGMREDNVHVEWMHPKDRGKLPPFSRGMKGALTMLRSD